MGACCGATQKDPGVENSKTIQDLINVFKAKKNRLPLEISQIKAHIVNPEIEVETINTDGVPIQVLKERIVFLQKLENAYNDVIIILTKNQNLDVEKTKPFLNEIAYRYQFSYDPDNELNEEMQRFQKFVYS